MAQRVKGSMLYMDDGESIFTPYNSNPVENTPWETLCLVPHGDIRRTKKILQLRITIDNSLDKKQQVRKLLDSFSKLIATYQNTKK